jgi:hypothetical protein
MAEMTYFAPSDLLGLSDGTNIILASSGGGARKQYVEVFTANGAYIPTAAVATRPHDEHTVEYELIGGSLALNIGAAVNTNYFITGVSANCGSEQYPRVSVTFLKFSAANKFNSGSKKGTITLTGGFGVVNLFGATAAGAISSSLSLTTQQAETLASTSGDYQEGGYAIYGLKTECSVESTTAITIPAGGKETASDENGSQTGAKIFSKSWFEYLFPTPPP